MKKKLMIMSTILLISIAVAGNTFAWFSTSTDGSGKKETPIKTALSTIDVSVLDTNARVKSSGTGKTYVRVRLIPQWSDPSLSVSNVELSLNSEDWTSKQADGYYYFKYYLNENQATSALVKSINISKTPEYDGAEFNLKTVAEGVQINNEAFKKVWKINSLPFTPDKPWSP